MKLLFENWRRYINEVSFSDAKEILDSKRTLKIIKAYRYDKEQDHPDSPMSTMTTQHRNFKNYLLDIVPSDLTDNQKGTAVLWLLKVARENPKVAASFINGRIFTRDRGSLETFFHHQRFMPRQDLMQVKTMEDLVDMTDAAKEEIQKAQEKKQYLDAEEGTEIFRDDNEWKIYALHNKGAACHYGKGTDWCTAAPGLDYFEHYYSPDDPLFYFQHFKKIPGEFADYDLGPEYDEEDRYEPAERYQFSYGSEMFNDAEDEPVDNATFKKLHNLLKQTKAYNKYEVIETFDKIFSLKEMIKRPDADINEMRKILNTLEDRGTVAATLAKIVVQAPFGSVVGPGVQRLHTQDPRSDYLRWFTSEEFYEYPEIAKIIVKWNAGVPWSILEDLAENNPTESTREMARATLERRNPLDISWEHDMGYDEFFTEDKLAELGIPSPITRENLNQYFNRLTTLYRQSRHIKELENIRRVWIQQMDEDRDTSLTETKDKKRNIIVRIKRKNCH